MTSTVKVQAHGQRVRVTKLHKPKNAAPTPEEDTLEAGSAERTYHIHSNMDLLVAEDTGQPKVPVVSSETFEQDLISLESEHSISPAEMISAYEDRLAALREQKSADEDADAEA